MLSGMCLAANVPGRSEYLNINAISNRTSRISDKVSSKSCSDSSENPQKISVPIDASGNIRRMAAMRSRYSSRVYFRFISFSVLLLPLCTGRCMYRQMLGYWAIISRVWSVISFGYEVVKRIRISGTARATFSSSCEKSVALPLPSLYRYESTFCPSSVTSL